MEFRNELREDCYWCHGKLTPHLSETVMGKYGDKEIIIKNVPRLECKKCNFYYSAEPFQEQKTEIFQKHLKSLPCIPDSYQIATITDTKNCFDYVKGFFDKADLIINATDPDREGER